MVTATSGVYPRRMGAVVVQQMKNTWTGKRCLKSFSRRPRSWISAISMPMSRGDTWTDPVAGTPELDNGQPTGVLTE